MEAIGIGEGELRDRIQMNFRQVENVMRGDAVGAETVLRIWHALEDPNIEGLVRQVGAEEEPVKQLEEAAA